MIKGDYFSMIANTFDSLKLGILCRVFLSLESTAFEHNVTCNEMCLKFSEDLLDCAGHDRIGDTSHGSVTCTPSASSPDSLAPLWLWEVLQRCPWDVQREVGRQEL